MAKANEQRGFRTSLGYFWVGLVTWRRRWDINTARQLQLFKFGLKHKYIVQLSGMPTAGLCLHIPHCDLSPQMWPIILNF